MSRSTNLIDELQAELLKLRSEKTLAQAKRTVLGVVRLLDDSVSIDTSALIQPLDVERNKIRANAGWFVSDDVLTDRRAAYKVHENNDLNIDFKLFGLHKARKSFVSWAVSLTPNFEDEPFNTKWNVGIDFVVPAALDRIFVVLSNNYIVRTLELQGELTVTYKEILNKWLEINVFSNKKELHARLWESFDLEPINKKFYAKVSGFFALIKEHLVARGVLDERHAAMFANRMIGRIIFCWFLDRKGVINPEMKYFETEGVSSTDFYCTKLESLFFEVLNTPVKDRTGKDDVTPYLNGGLFEPVPSDLCRTDKLTFPDGYFKELFEFLQHYNFTTDESTSQFQQVAIDPEMLGRIFENLLAEMVEETGEQARKAKGAFYTPREIVDYMCRESLKQHLKNQIPEDEYRNQRLGQLIDGTEKEFTDQDHNWRRDWKPYKDAIIKALDSFTVLDPACGSGAFPMGMLQLLVRTYERLETRFDPYKTKLGIIKNNLYGVDIEPIAVEICRLRAWLSIVVDEESDSKNIKPLPNLEFKFVCANSLLPLITEDGQGQLFDKVSASELITVRDEYFSTASKDKKARLRRRYETLMDKGQQNLLASEREKQLRTYRPFDNEASAVFFDPIFMFGTKERFDAVVGNPPYVNVKRGIDEKDKEKYRALYLSARGQFDLFTLFIERALTLSRDSVSYIVPKPFINSENYSFIRKMVLDSGLKQIVVGSDVFETAAVESCIFVSSKLLSSKTVGILKYEDGDFEKRTEIEKEVFYGLPFNIISDELTTKDLSIIEKLSTLPTLDSFLTVMRGVEAGKKDASIGSGTYKLLTGEDVRAWEKDYQGLTIKFDIADSKKFKSLDLYTQPKILIRRVASELIAALDYDDYIVLNTVYCAVPIDQEKTNIKVAAAILNSKLIKYWFNKVFASADKLFPYIRQSQLGFIPMKFPSADKERDFEVLVDEIATLKATGRRGPNMHDCEKKLDGLIYELYGLTPEQVNLIESGITV